MAISQWGWTIVRIIKLLAVAYLVFLVLLFLAQRRFIYHPSRASRQSLDGFAKAHGFEAWENGSGQYIGWKQLSVVKPRAGPF